MGLLDDAIREHLELKRLRGADPGEVAREQREALDPVPRDTHTEQDDQGDHAVRSSVLEHGAVEHPAGDVGDVEAVDGVLDEGGEHSAPPQQPVHGAGFSRVGQETAELDMRIVLGEELAAPQGPEQLAGSDGETSAGEHAREDSLEWEVPGGSSGAPATDGAGGEHFAGEERLTRTSELPGESEESAEDVLEETPDFLRDTPEQERLWFEQRPPRDFDFDK